MKRALFAAVAAGAALVVPATSALAHVTVNPREATAGGYAKLAFRVPNERDDAGTTKLEVNFPPEHPFASVGVRPTDGWTYTLEKTKLSTPITAHGDQISEAPSKITWTGGTIKPGEFEEFEISLGPLPEDADSLTFRALQTYSSGEVVRWIEEASPGGAEVERPAPVLKLTKAAASTDTPSTTAPASEAQSGAVGADDVATKDDVNGARTFGILGMVFGLVGLVTAATARRKRPPAP